MYLQWNLKTGANLTGLTIPYAYLVRDMGWELVGTNPPQVLATEPCSYEILHILLVKV